MTEKFRHRLCTVAIGIAAMVLTACSNEGYRVEDGKVFWHLWTFSFGPLDYELKDVDVESFRDMKDHYARDKQYAWHEQHRLEGADGSRFRNLKHGYACDDKLVYCRGKLVYGADAQTFRIHSERYCEDSRDCYWNGHPLYVADRQSFGLVGGDNDDTEWGRDSKFVYFLRATSDSVASRSPKRMPIADYDTFGPVPQKADVKGDVLSGWYARDKYRVYYCDTIVPGADPATFCEVGWDVCRDKNFTYERGKVKEK